MERWRGRLVVSGAGIAAGLLYVAAAGWACVPVATVTVTPAEARPGSEVTVSGIRFPTASPVVVRLHSMDGPTLATIPMPRSANTLFTTKFTVPQDAKPGPLVVLALQDPDPETGSAGWGVPARAIVTVLDADGKAPPTTISAVSGRPAALAEDKVDVGLVLLLVSSVAAGSLVLVCAAALAAGWRPARSGPAPAPSERGSPS